MLKKLRVYSSQPIRWRTPPEWNRLWDRIRWNAQRSSAYLNHLLPSSATGRSTVTGKPINQSGKPETMPCLLLMEPLIETHFELAIIFFLILQREANSTTIRTIIPKGSLSNFWISTTSTVTIEPVKQHLHRFVNSNRTFLTITKFSTKHPKQSKSASSMRKKSMVKSTVCMQTFCNPAIKRGHWLISWMSRKRQKEPRRTNSISILNMKTVLMTTSELSLKMTRWPRIPRQSQDLRIIIHSWIQKSYRQNRSWGWRAPR